MPTPSYHTDELEQRVTERTAALLHLNERLQQEINEYKRVEQTLRESEARFRRLSEATSEGIMFHEHEHILDANHIMARMFGYEQAELIGMNCLDLLAEDVRFRSRAQILTRSEQPYQTIGLHKDGRMFPLEILTRVIPYQGRVVKVTTLHDITERQRAEEALRESEQRFRLMAENSTDLISRQAPDSTYLYVSPACYSLLGYQPEELLGQHSIDLMHPEDRQATLKPYTPTSDFPEPLTLWHRLRHKDGTYVWFESIIRVIRDQNTGMISEVQIASRDITERRRVEQALEAERMLLARRVAERTRELSAANVELARSARLKDEFLASMSHELRTPLNAVLGLSETLQELIYGPLNERQLRALQSIEESGRHLLALINDILDLSKIEAGKLDLQLEEIAIEPVCQASLRLIRQDAHQKRLEVSCTFDSSVSKIVADERRLKQILVNLLSNAVKFTPSGGSIGLEVVGDPDNDIVRLTVWDTGIGIAHDDLPRLFRPFIQLDSSLARSYNGTGLGLVLVSRMVELHGGSVSVESAVSEGSRFTIWLPQNRRLPQSLPEDDQHLEQLNMDVPMELVLSSERATILVVEDHEDNLLMFCDYLQSKEYNVVLARNGREALIQARATRPDLILMDVQMPGMDGLEATRLIRADPLLSSTPVIALTALAMHGDRERCLEAGANAYLSKPVSLKQLIQLIETHITPVQQTGENGAWINPASS